MIQCHDEAHGIIAVSIYDRATCASFIERAKESDGWLTAQVRGGTPESGYQTVTRPSDRSARVLSSNIGAEMVRDFDEKIDSIIKPMIKERWDVGFTEHSGTQIIRYGPGGHYKAHADAGFDLQSRYFTVVCYLNDDFEGGQTSFPSLNYATTPESGKAIVFPACFLHCAEPVIKGEKFVFVAWVDGPIATKWI